MELSHIQKELIKRHMGPAFGFIKLRLGIPRNQGMVAEIAMKWTKLLRTGAFGVKFMGIGFEHDLVQHGTWPENIRVEGVHTETGRGLRNQVFRRPGDPPLEEVIEQLRQSKKDEEVDKHQKEEL